MRKISTREVSSITTSAGLTSIPITLGLCRMALAAVETISEGFRRISEEPKDSNHNSNTEMCLEEIENPMET